MPEKKSLSQSESASENIDMASIESDYLIGRRHVVLTSSPEKLLFQAAKIVFYDALFVSFLFLGIKFVNFFAFDFLKIGSDGVVQVILSISGVMLIVLYLFIVVFHLIGLYQREIVDIKEQKKW
jgi:hypothetical protein